MIVGRNTEAIEAGMTFPDGKATRWPCCKALKTDAPWSGRSAARGRGIA
jgi:hypothetical protein